MRAGGVQSPGRPARRRYNAPVTATRPNLAPALLAWYRRCGRHDLPWQKERTPYRVWVSEVMLQQTQVSTVIPYYQRFMARFPDVRALAEAPLDEVLHLWSGLGYYARARNLKRAAQLLVREHGGEFPQAFAAVAALPGVGRSTAGAILALARNERYPILDGNARRVVSRYFGIGTDPAKAATRARLWELADAQTPDGEAGDYTQAIMDLGATVCVRRRPLCAQCPLHAHCSAYLHGRQHEIPPPKRAAPRRRRSVYMVVALTQAGEVLLERRPPSGVWGGLWCLPEFTSERAAAAFVRGALGTRHRPRLLAPLEHGFTHFDLEINPLLVPCAASALALGEAESLWYNIRSPARIGLPAPITTLLAGLAEPSLFDPAAYGA